MCGGFLRVINNIKIKFVQTEGHAPFQGEDNRENIMEIVIHINGFSRTNQTFVKGIQILKEWPSPLPTGDYFLKTSSRGTGPILTRLDTNYPRVEEIGFSLNEGPFFIQRGKEFKYNRIWHTASVHG